MKRSTLSSLCLLTAAALALLSGCAATTHPKVQAAGDAYLSTHFAANPINGTNAGLRQYDGRPLDYSAAALRRYSDQLTQQRQQLDSLLATTLDRDSSVKARMLRAAIDGELFMLNIQRKPYNNPMFYASAADVSSYAKRDFAPLSNRLADATSVLESVPSVIAAAKANLEPALPRVFITTAITIADGQADFISGDLVKGFDASTDTAAKARLRAAADQAAAAMRDYSTWLQTEKLPRGTDAFAIGRPAYVKMLAEQELISETPEQILAIGERELARLTAIFNAAAKEIDPTKPAAEVWLAVQNDHPTAASLIPDTRKHLEEIRTFLIDKDLISFPRERRVLVDETPGFLRATSFASMDTPGPFEKVATESFYYVTPPETTWDAAKTNEWLTAFNYYTTDVVSIHEAYPGHFEQAMHLQTSNISGAFAYIGSYAYIEGWAHYCEEMAIQEGFPPASLSTAPHAAAKYRMAMCSEALLRVCRLIASIKMHTQGWTIDQATAFFSANCYYPEAPARSEAQRGTYGPGYLLYTLGKLQFFQLRADLKAQQGNSYSIKEFHNTVLRYGMPQLRLLRERLLNDPASWDRTLN
jgi:uncharacterized protein (DUF885 family)